MKRCAQHILLFQESYIVVYEYVILAYLKNFWTIEKKTARNFVQTAQPFPSKEFMSVR